MLLGALVVLFSIVRVYGMMNPTRSLFENQEAVLAILITIVIITALFAVDSGRRKRRINFEKEKDREPRKPLPFPDNSPGLPAEKAFELIKGYFSKDLPSFQFVQQVINDEGYWIRFTKDDITVQVGQVDAFIEEPLSFMQYEVTKGEKEIPFYDIDYRLKFLQTTSEKNLYFLLDRIKEYIKDLEPKYPLEIPRKV